MGKQRVLNQESWPKTGLICHTSRITFIDLNIYSIIFHLIIILEYLSVRGEYL